MGNKKRREKGRLLKNKPIMDNKLKVARRKLCYIAWENLKSDYTSGEIAQIFKLKKDVFHKMVAKETVQKNG